MFGLYAIGFWIMTVLQFVQAYYQLGEFDIGVAGFLATLLLLFTPLLLFGTFVTAEYIRRWRLNVWMRKNLTYSEYDIEFPPAESGLLLDYKFGQSEVIATLLDLHFRHIVYMGIEQGTLHLKLVSQHKKDLSIFEHELLNQLFRYEKARSFEGFSDVRLLQATRKAHKKLLQWKEESGLMLRLIPKLLEPFMPILMLLALAGFLVSIIAVFALFSDYETASTIQYPRYPVAPIQLIAVSIVSLCGLAVLLSSFWPRFSNHHKSQPVAAWVKTYGLRLYLKTVYTERFSTDNISHLSSQDIKKYAPYMIAFELAPNDLSYLKQVLQAVKV